MDPIGLKQWAIFGRPIGPVSDPSTEYIKRIEYNHDGRSLSEAVRSLDNTFKEILVDIRDSNGQTDEYALGLSGGLDSRLALHYATKVGIEPNLFFFGYSNTSDLVELNKNRNMSMKRKFRRQIWEIMDLTNISIDTYDFSMAKSVAKIYDMDDITTIPFDTKPDLEKIESYTRAKWAGSYDLWKYQVPEDQIPQHDVLLSGFAGGENLGGNLPAKVSEMTPEEVTDHIFSVYGTNEPITGILSPEEYEQIRNEILEFISSFDSMIEAFQSFLLGYFARGNVIFNSESPFTHELFKKERETWNPEWLVDAQIQKEFYNQVHPNLEKIPDQTGNPPFPKRDSWFWNQYYRRQKQLRGSALDYEVATTNPDFINWGKSILSTENEQFERHFDIDKLVSYLESGKYSGNAGIIPTILCIKIALDLNEEGLTGILQEEDVLIPVS